MVTCQLSPENEGIQGFFVFFFLFFFFEVGKSIYPDAEAHCLGLNFPGLTFVVVQNRSCKLEWSSQA